MLIHTNITYFETQHFIFLNQLSTYSVDKLNLHIISKIMEDTYRHKGLRKLLVEELRKKGITDERILLAIGKIPRHIFMDSSFINYSYKDKAFPIGAGQTISQPYTVAIQTMLLQVKQNDKILEIGTGSGYQAAVLMEMGARVYTIERLKELYLKAQDILPKLGYNAYFFYGDGNLGLPTYAPFDKILITAGATEVPEKLLKQVRVGGRIVLPLGSKGSQEMIVIERTGEDEYTRTSHGNFVFVPLLKGTV
jgi:protein-L-isoaspartate(D-aspartate) O-methyltransferase